MKESMVFAFNILIKEEDSVWISHCLELDIVAVADSASQAESELIDLIIAQLNYALSHDNMKNFFHPAPEEVMMEFYKCKDRKKAEKTVKPRAEKNAAVKPPSYLLISNSTSCLNTCCAH